VINVFVLSALFQGRQRGAVFITAYVISCPGHCAGTRAGYRRIVVDVTTADDFSPYILAEGKAVLELGKSSANLGNFATKLGKFDPDGGKPGTELGKSASNGGNPNMKLGNFIVNRGNSGRELGKSTAIGSNFTLDGGNPVPYHNKEKP
jgi:hypothetical protein